MRRVCLYCARFHHNENVYDGREEVLPGIFAPKMKTIEMHCDKYPEKCKQWWERNGNVTSDEAEEMDCFEFTKSDQKLQDLIDQATDILDQVKKKE